MVPLEFNLHVFNVRCFLLQCSKVKKEDGGKGGDGVRVLQCLLVVAAVADLWIIWAYVDLLSSLLLLQFEFVLD